VACEEHVHFIAQGNTRHEALFQMRQMQRHGIKLALVNPAWVKLAWVKLARQRTQVPRDRPNEQPVVAPTLTSQVDAQEHVPDQLSATTVM
jgi:hypothetical protein